jgi:hypothetical protein
VGLIASYRKNATETQHLRNLALVKNERPKSASLRTPHAARQLRPDEIDEMARRRRHSIVLGRHGRDLRTHRPRTRRRRNVARQHERRLQHVLPAEQRRRSMQRRRNLPAPPQLCAESTRGLQPGIFVQHDLLAVHFRGVRRSQDSVSRGSGRSRAAAIQRCNGGNSHFRTNSTKGSTSG